MNRTPAVSTFPLLLVALSTPALAQFPYGTGAAGSGALTPSLSCQQPWVGRSTFTIDIGNGRGGSAGFLLMGFDDDNARHGGLPLHVDLVSLVSSTFVVLGGAPGVPGAGELALPLPLSAVSPAFIGLKIYAQAALLDPAGPGFGGGWTATNGLMFEFTRTPQVFAACDFPNYTFDPHWAVNGLSQTIDFSGNLYTDFINGAAYTNDGQDLYTSSRLGGVMHAELSSGAPVWTPLNVNLPVGAVGVPFNNCVIDRERQLLWIVSGAAAATVQLRALDINEGNASYGQILHQTTWLGATVGSVSGSTLVGAWGMNNGKTLAAVSSRFNGSLYLVDTDPASATFLQLVASSPIPPSSYPNQLIGSVNLLIRFSPDDRECYVMIGYIASVPGEIARFSVPAGTWLDHNPATPIVDHIGWMASPQVPFDIALADFDVGRDGSVYVTGGNGTGYVGRVILAGPAALYTPLNATSSLANARKIALNRDQNVLAVAVTNPTTTVVFFDAATLNEIGAASLGGNCQATVLTWR